MEKKTYFGPINISLILSICLLSAFFFSPSMLNKLSDPDSVPISPTRFQFMKISYEDMFLPGMIQNETLHDTTREELIQQQELSQNIPISSKKIDTDADSTIRTGFTVSVDQEDNKVKYSEKYQMIGTLFDIKAAFQYGG